MKNFAKIIHALVTILILAYLITGLGITQYRLITPLTGGWLDKAAAFRIHAWLFWPFVIVLGLHIGLALGRKRRSNQ